MNKKDKVVSFLFAFIITLIKSIFFVPLKTSKGFFGYFNFLDAFGGWYCPAVIGYDCVFPEPIIYLYILEGILLFIIVFVICNFVLKGISNCIKK